MSLCTKIAQALTASALTLSLAQPINAQTPYSSVDRLIRTIPYQGIVPGAANNWQENRLAIMNNQGFCSEGKNVFLDMNGVFLGSVERTVYDEEELSRREISIIRSQNQRRIDSWRRQHNQEGNAVAIHPHGGAGYPFAYSCEDKNKEFVQQGIDSYFGLREEALIQEGWGPYTIEGPVSVREVFQKVERNFPSFSEHTRDLLRGQYIIESGGLRDANSQHAEGIMQIIPYNLKSICGLEQSDWLNEFAQIHCAHILLEQDAQRLKPLFDAHFNHLSIDKQERLFANLLAHGYHAGPRLFRDMMNSGEQGAATRFYARNHEEFSADDIAKGLLFHNYGAPTRGFQTLRNASLKYVSDTKATLILLEERAQELGIPVK